MTDVVSLVMALAPLAEQAGFIPNQIELIIGLRTRRWPIVASAEARWRPTAAQLERAEMLLEICVAATSLMGDSAGEWLEDWARHDRRQHAELQSAEFLHRLRLELRRQFGLS